MKKIALFALALVLSVMAAACLSDMATPTPTSTSATTVLISTPLVTPTEVPSPVHTGVPTEEPTEVPTPTMASKPTPVLTIAPTATPVPTPTSMPEPTLIPTLIPEPEPTPTPTPTAAPTAISGVILDAAGQTAKGFAVAAWSRDDVEYWEQAGPDGTFEIQVPKGVYALQIWQQGEDGVWLSAGWYDGHGRITAERSRAFELSVDGEAVEGIEVGLETARQEAEKRLGHLLSWFTAPPDQQHSLAGSHILEIQLLDRVSGEGLAHLPWVADGIVDEGELQAVASLARLARTDTAIARRVMVLPWASDYITDAEKWTIAELAWLAETDTALAQRVADFPWFTDAPSTHSESSVIGALAYFASEYPALSERVAAFPWFADDITEAEERGLYSLRKLADTDLALAQRVAALPWFADGITEVEQGVLAALRADPEMARAWLDGVHDDEAMALMAVLGYARSTNIGGGLLYDDLLDAHFFQRATVSLPLAGEVNLWAFQSKPFPPDEDLAAMIEDAVRATEGFMGVRFPATDVILIVTIGVRGGELWEGFFTARRYEPDLVSRATIYHELAHYYFTFGPRWLVEGGAEFMASYTYDQAGLKSLEDQKPAIWSWVEATCFDEGISNIHQLNEREFRDPGPPLTCNYSLGSYFLMELYEAVGEDALSATLREIYLEFRDQDHTVLTEEEGRLVFVNEAELHRVEEVFYQTLLNKTPAGREDAFLEVYRRLHGGPHAD